MERAHSSFGPETIRQRTPVPSPLSPMMMKSTHRFAFALLGSTALLPAGAPPTFLEKNGVVSIEAEHYTDMVGPWEEVEGRNATELNHGTSADHRMVVADAEHPLAGGLRGEIALPRNSRLQWGFPNEHANVAVVAGHDPRKAVVYGYEKGARLPGGFAAPGRRVSTMGPRENLPESIALFDAAIRWATDGSTHPPSALQIVQEIPLRVTDALAKQRLEHAGFTVKLAMDRSVETSDTAGHALVVFSPSVRFEGLVGKFRDIAAAIVLADKRPLSEDLGLSLPPTITPPGGNAMLIRSGGWADHLRYAIHFESAGTYRLWALGQSAGDPGADEVKVFFNETPQPRSERFFELRFPDRPDWTDRAFVRRADNRKTPAPAMIEVPAPGWHNLYLVKGAEPEHHGEEPPLSRHYPNWRVDKLVLLRTDTLRPHGEGPPETRNDGTEPVPEAMIAQMPWLPTEIWPVRQGYTVFEAEDLTYHRHWILKTDPEGFTGRGYLEWRGPNHAVTVEGHFGNNDHLHIRQGSREDWLILRFDVAEAGAYRLDVRNHHLHVDGDNDTWIAPLHKRGERNDPIVRIGDSLGDGPGFSWLDWGVQRFEFERGLNEVRIGGRSIGFGIDRIALYRDGDDLAKARALDPKTPPARPMTGR